MSNFPLPVFHFRVVFPGNKKIAFQEVSGISATLEYEDASSNGRNTGGSNDTVRKRYKSTKFGDVTFKRGVFADYSVFYDLLYESFNMDIERKDTEGNSNNILFPDIQVFLVGASDPEGYLYAWTLHNVYLKSWTLGDFNAMENKLMVESFVVGIGALTATI